MRNFWRMARRKNHKNMEKDVERQLPEAFRRSMRDLIPQEYGEYLDSLQKPGALGLRVNTCRWTPQECVARTGLSLTPVPWTTNGFYYEEGEQPAKDPYYYAGLYYLQEPSAMAPASLLPVEPGDRVLDLCAAPGGKSTELGARLKGEGLLFANDISSSRAKGLLKNLERFGLAQICVASETPEKLAAAYPEYFNKILVDAPCSGEGMFRRESAMIREWQKRGPGYYAPLQRKLLDWAVRLLQPGGTLMYSTCTFSRLENEEAVLEMLGSHPELELLPIPAFEGAEEGSGLPGCLKLFPHRIKGEGHFIAMLQKKQSSSRPEETRPGCGEAYEAPCEMRRFLEHTNTSWEWNRFFHQGESVYYLPKGFWPVSGIRYLRTGLWMGTIKNNRFEPSQALAMVLDSRSFTPSISFCHGDDRVLRYLKGETVELREEPPIKGWCLVCVEGFSLGFAKGMSTTLKNKYNPGWRWM